MATLPTITVEVAFATDPDASAPAWQDVSDRVMAFTIKRGRQYELDTMQAGRLTLQLKNGDRAFDPGYTYSPYAPYLLPMRKIRVSAAWSGTTYYLFTGYVERWPITWAAPAFTTVTVTAVDAFAALSSATITGTFAEDYTGNRVSTVLSAAMWPASSPASGYWTLGTSALDSTAVLSYGIPTTLIDVGRSLAQEVEIADADDVSALAHIQAMEATERGVFFVDGQGRLVFQDRWSRYNQASLVTFTDGAKSSTRLPYDTAMTPDLDVARIVNECKVTRTGGTTQTASDGASRGNYFRRSLSLSVALTTDTEANDRAWFEVALGKEPKLRFERLPIKPAANEATWPYALGLDIGDKITVERTPDSLEDIPSETTIRNCFIEAVEHTFSPASLWDTAYQLSPADVYDQFFILDTGALDSSDGAALAY